MRPVKNKKILVNLALNYGSKKELINSFKKYTIEKSVKKALIKTFIPAGYQIQIF